MRFAPDPVRVPAAASGIPHGRALSRGNALGVTSMILWAAGFPAADILLQSWHPLTLITARLALTVAFLVPLWLLLEGPRALRGAPWGKGLMIGGSALGLGTFLLLYAQSLTDPVTVALIASATPIAATIIELAYGLRRLQSGFVLGLLASVLGGVIATNAVAPADLGPGAAMAVASSFLFSWGSFACIRTLPMLSPLGSSAVTMTGALLSMAAVLGLGLLAGMDLMPQARPDPAQWIHLAIYALLGMAISQVLFIASVRRIGVAQASLHINIAPFYVMVILLVLGHGWHWPQTIGGAVVACGVVLAQRGGHGPQVVSSSSDGITAKN
ncbi:MAG: DMT family transporter [Marinibacterium sp.]|nr:DMT family transporter [Marinibacterium sp.]